MGGATDNLRPEDVIGTRGDAVLYLIGQALLAAAVVAVLGGILAGSTLAVFVALALGLPAQVLRTLIVRRFSARLGKGLPAVAGWRRQAWLQRQLDRRAVFAQAVGALGGGRRGAH